MRRTLLALETSGRSGSVAILCADTATKLVSSPLLSVEGFSITTELLAPEWGSARTLAPAIDRLLRRMELKPSSIDCITLIQGPGSFTGLRVGVATAKAMAYALRIPIVAVDGLDTIALQVAQSLDQTASFPLLTVVDAYRGQSFVAQYYIESGIVRTVQSTFVEDHQAIAKRVSNWLTNDAGSTRGSQSLVVAGPGAAKLKKSLDGASNATEMMSENVCWISDGTAIPMADTVARLGWERWIHQGQTEDVFGFLPRYYRSSAAEEKLR
ncbi:MAG: tRNA (adenosine(37)-N6)-threonylcarbamoyltransferase complex dimerization subunit type 1 TsaB [Planctomycetes bacterium]|nr:tRNA (adenosine(37)-N6)-threonylcarbamoyltransferase complex dimerization subunit type 1 TsaB [Planctomycetota bacterium]